MPKPCREIGSEFWTEALPSETNGLLDQLSGDVRHMMSGRSAIHFVLNELESHKSQKTAYLPAYTCHTVLNPFLQAGYAVYFYDVDTSLRRIFKNSEAQKVSVLLTHGYFGFSDDDADFLYECRKRGTIIIHDITHSMFSSGGISTQADYIVGSVRKWFGVPAGGIAISLGGQFHAVPDAPDAEYLKLRKKALDLKGKYMPDSSAVSKTAFRQDFEQAVDHLEQHAAAQSSDDASVDYIRHYPIESMRLRRRENFEFLLSHLGPSEKFKPVFSSLPEGICPLFFPIMSEERNDIRNKCAALDVYLPIHWPVPDGIDLTQFPGASKIYQNILSVPCDQRYGLEDMRRITEVFACLK